MKYIDGRLGRWEKSKQGSLWDSLMSKTERHILLLHWRAQVS